MATYSVAKLKRATLAASTVDTVTLTNDFAAVMVRNQDGASAITVLVDSGATDPTVAMDDADEILPAAIGDVVIPSRGTGNTQVKLISSGTPIYLVKGVQ